MWFLGMRVYYRGFFPTKEMQGHTYMKDAHCAESNEKSIFQIFIFELWLILQSKFIKIDQF